MTLENRGGRDAALPDRLGAGCHTQARSLDELVTRVQEAIAVSHEDHAL